MEIGDVDEEEQGDGHDLHEDGHHLVEVGRPSVELVVHLAPHAVQHLGRVDTRCHVRLGVHLEVQCAL